MGRALAYLFIIMGILVTGVILYAGDHFRSPIQEPFPSCGSMGIQIFKEKKEAPNFSLTSLDGRTICLNDLRGKPIILVFWATWCETCRDELPALEKFFSKRGDQLNVLLLAIDGERKRTVQKIIQEKMITLPVLLVLKEKVMDHYGVRGWVPQLFFIDKDGVLVGKILGPRDWKSPQAWSCLKEILNLP
jgi:peroxiredoxin